MRKFLISVVLATSTLAAVPAAAQSRDHHPGFNQRGPSRPAVNNLLRQIENVDVRITRAEQRRTISRREAAGLRRDSNDIRRTYARYSRNGLDRQEVRDLQRRVNQVHMRLRYEQRDWDRGRR